MSAIALSRTIAKSSRFVKKTVDILATIDPVDILHPVGPVLNNVNLYWNRYESKTKDGGVPIVLLGVPIYYPHGRSITSNAQTTDQPAGADLNNDGEKRETDKFLYGDYNVPGQPFYIDHWNIIGVVRNQFENLFN